MERKQIQSRFYRCLNQHFPTQRFAWETLDPRQPLTGAQVGFRARTLLYLLYALEEEFGLRFTQEDVIDYQWLTLEGILQTLERKMPA